MVPADQDGGRKRRLPPMMDEGRCPFCGSDRVRLSRSSLRHLLRGVMGTHRRFCPACSRGWTSQARASGPLTALGLAVALAAITLALAAAFVGVSSRKPPARPRLAAAPASSAAKGGTPGSEAVPAAEAGDPEADIEGEVADPEAGPGTAGQAEGQPSLVEDGKRGRSGPIRLDPPSDAGRRPGFGEMLGDAWRLLKGLTRSQAGAVESDLERLDKKQLWEKYGRYFGSKDEAKRAYEQYKGRKESVKPGSGKQPAP